MAQGSDSGAADPMIPGKMRFTIKWLGVILIATAIDLVVRFGGLGDFALVLWVESLLLPLTGLALYLVFRTHPKPSGFKRGLQVVLVWAFILAGARAGIRAAGFDVGIANLVIFLMAVLAALLFWITKRRKAKAGK